MLAPPWLEDKIPQPSKQYRAGAREGRPAVWGWRSVHWSRMLAVSVLSADTEASD